MHMPGFDLTAIQRALNATKIDGWLFYEFQGNDPIAQSILNIPDDKTQTRRWWFYIPQRGVPIKLVHGIERDILDHLPGKKEVYLSWQEMEEKLEKIFKGGGKVAIQYSPRNAIPSISKIDAGTFELLKSFHLDLITSAGLVQQFEACWTPAQLSMHINVAKQLSDIINKTFKLIKRKIEHHEEVNEYIVQRYVMNEIKSRSLVSDYPAIVSTGKNSGNPHYYPAKNRCAPIYPGSIVQLNLSAKERNEQAVYAVVAWVGYVGYEIPEEYSYVFAVIRDTRNQVIDYLEKAVKAGKKFYGYQVDELARTLVKAAGYESYFLHRTGHSIGKELNAHGVNIDSLETRDDREIIAGSCFSIQPGLYFSDYGMRSEINVYVAEDSIHIYTQPLQQEIVPILK
jgi:Xaa-Pro dipeptidase